MRLALSMRIVEDPRYGERRDALAQAWGVFLRQALPKALWWPIPNDPGMVAGRLNDLAPDGILLTGGDDWGVYPQRDATEKLMLEWALQKKNPVFGVCRGAQVINLLLGGSLDSAPGHAGVRHLVRSSGRSLEVNSYHGNVVREAGLAPGCRVLASAADGTVESFEHREKGLLAVMWHPERESEGSLTDMAMLRKFFRSNDES